MKDVIVTKHYSSSKNMSMGSSLGELPFFYIYETLFCKLFIILPFDAFKIEGLSVLNVEPIQFHPNN